VGALLADAEELGDLNESERSRLCDVTHLPPNHDSHSGYDEEDSECHLKACVQPEEHARDA
jgi:hypothetical protein